MRSLLGQIGLRVGFVQTGGWDTVGMRVGLKVGLLVGFLVGLTVVGRRVFAVGERVGLRVDGLIVGCFGGGDDPIVGAAVGFEVGARVGVCDGFSVGAYVGPADGIGVGLYVGDGVGIGVGWFEIGRAHV